MELKKYRKQITTLKPSYYTQAFIVSVLSIFMDHATAQAVSLWPLEGYSHQSHLHHSVILMPVLKHKFSTISAADW